MSEIEKKPTSSRKRSVEVEKPVEAVNPLESLTVQARGLLGSALRQLIAAHVLETDPVRIKTENALAAVVADLSNHTFSRATLDRAAEQFTAVITLLANNTFTRQDQLTAFRGEANVFAKAVAALPEV